MSEAGIFDKVQALLGGVTKDEAIKMIERLDEEIKEKQAEQAKWRALLGLKEQLGEAATDTNGSRPVLPRAILAVMHEYPYGAHVRLADLGQELQRRGWLPRDKNAFHRLQLAAAKLVKRGELERPERGYYKLPPTAQGPGGGSGDRDGG